MPGQFLGRGMLIPASGSFGYAETMTVCKDTAVFEARNLSANQFDALGYSRLKCRIQSPSGRAAVIAPKGDI